MRWGLKKVFLSVLVGITYIYLHIVAGADIDVGPSTAVSASVGTSFSLWCKVNTWTSGWQTEWTRRTVVSPTILTQDCVTADTTKYSVNPCDQTNHNFTLVISNVQFSDAGGYECGHKGMKCNRVIVTVIAAPRGTRLLNTTTDIKVRAQQDTTFLCETKAYPVATVSWEIDGTAVTSGVTHSNSPRDNITQLITTTSTLKYMFQKTQGSKTVTCKASNIASGSTPAVASVNVDIVWPVESVSLNCTNSTLHLDGATVYCQSQTVGGHPAGMVKWTDVTARPSPYTLPIDATRASNHRIYRCEGYNDVNTNRPSAAIQLNVAYPPSNVGITSNPVTPLLAGSSPTLTCEASDKGNPAPNYRWWNSSNNNITDTESAGKSVITVGPLTDRDNGQIYHCEASNYYTINKPSTSPTAEYTLNVEFNPIISTRASPSSTVKEGDDVTLTCDVTKANPTVTSYVWSRTQDRNNGVHTQASYTINQIQVEQNGTYTCYATAQSSRHGNLVGESSITITVKYLRVSVESIPATLENSSVNIHCKPEGIPGSFVYSNWQFLPLTGGQPVDLQRNQNPLVLNNVQYTDAGTYICTASNSQFTKTSNGTLAVKYAAKKDPSPDRVTNLEVSADIGESATLTLYTIAYPIPTSYSWRKINGSLPSTYNQTDLEYASTLRVDKLRDSDYGTYIDQQSR
ncbi:hemicentin-1-like [Lingula anatina]|uniref:Hemicentin-1-like n=1 Tax=Lingula anatina TaxID=7574 RepID=A0A1S3HS32_LINAN|nr:hemicentin-1-like [Lingula anatina]|eukprot:XP_013387864.1 hemicentin-1-like [Lingula anatina]